MMSKKKVLDVINSSFKIYTRYSRIDDEEQKKVLSVFGGSFLSFLVGGGLKKVWETLLKTVYYYQLQQQ